MIDPAHQSQRIIGVQEMEVTPIAKRFIQASASFVDVGASDGEYTILAKSLNPRLRVVGCDADPANKTRFQRNAALNGLPAPDSEWVAGFIGTAHIPLDSITDDLPSPVTLKIDVDGGEMDVLASGTRVLQRPDTRIVLEVHSQALEQDCIELLESMGYHCRVVDQAWWRKVLPELRPGWNRWVIATKS